MGANTRKIKKYSVRIQEVNCEFGFETELSHLEKQIVRKWQRKRLQVLLARETQVSKYLDKSY